MREKQLIQLLQFIVLWVLVRWFVVFVMEESFVDFILKYRLYLLIVSVSYFYYYSIQYDPDKKSEVIRNIIIYWNLYLFAHVFFRPLLNISHQLFILLWLIILWIWWTTKLKSRWKYLLQILWWIFSFFILISWIFYLYPDKPDVEWFIKGRQSQIFVLWIINPIPQRDAYIEITDSKKSNKFDIIPYFDKNLVENCRISYPSLKKQREEKVFIVSSYWDVFWIFPQSEIQLEFEQWILMNISKDSWRIWFLSWVFTSSLNFYWEPEVLSIEQQEWIQSVQYQYKYDFISYLKNQISDNNISLVNNTVMYNIDWVIIKFLAKMFPATFTRNLDNYKEFQKYFDWLSDGDDWLDKYSMKWQFSIGSLWGNIKNNIKFGRWNVYDLFNSH